MMKRLSIVAAFVMSVAGLAFAQHKEAPMPKCGAGEVVVVHKDGSRHCVKEAEAEKSCPGGGSAMRDCRTYGFCIYLCGDKLPPR
jgi:hypothetical protein